MKTIATITTLLALPALAADPALTIYNANYAVVRDSVSLDLKKGTNDVVYSGVTYQLEPDSVILRDRSGKTQLRILEQSYRGDVLSQGLLLSMNEGKTVDFIHTDVKGVEHTVPGTIIRSGYVPNRGGGYNRGGASAGQPIIEVYGKLRFSLPGQPIFPSLGNDTILEPTLTWSLASDRQAAFDAEISYITGGMAWQSAYNLVFPEKGDKIDVVGWVTLTNSSGTTFENAAIKLLAGDVNKIQPERSPMAFKRRAMAMENAMMDAAVTEKSFDEFHLYTLPRPVTLRDSETKQIEFIRATGIKAKTLYIYNGSNFNWNNYRGWSEENLRTRKDLGGASNTKVSVYREFENTKENGLGIPLPKGKARFYRQDDADGRLEFTGENMIDHSPQGEDVRIYTGDSFDLVGEHKQTNYLLDDHNRKVEESYEITLRNRKKEAAEIIVAEPLFRGLNWEIIEKSDDYEKVDSRNIRFTVKLKPEEERKVTYTVRYTWK